MKTTRAQLLRLMAPALIVTGSGCVTMPGPAPEAVAGCYYFERDEVAQALRLPWGVRLLADTIEGWPALQQLPDVRRAITLVDYDDAVGHPFGYWRPLNADSLEIGYPGGGGLLLELELEPARLIGTARPVGDVALPPGEVSELAPQPVSLIHARCPDEPG